MFDPFMWTNLRDFMGEFVVVLIQIPIYYFGFYASGHFSNQKMSFCTEQTLIFDFVFALVNFTQNIHINAMNSSDCLLGGFFFFSNFLFILTRVYIFVK